MTTLCILVILACAVVFFIPGAFEGLQNKIASSKIEKLEKAKADAEAKSAELQSKVDEKGGEVIRLNGELTQAYAAVIAASQRTGAAQQNYNQVIHSKPVFTAPDNAGKVSELAAALNELYPN